jgi:hypothetical protein
VGFECRTCPQARITCMWELQGFAPYEQRGLVLSVGQKARIRAVVQPPSVNQTVLVTAQPPALDSARTSVATVIDTGRIEELPVRSRNALEFALLAPGVMRAAPVVQPGGRRWFLAAGSASPASAREATGFKTLCIQCMGGIIANDPEEAVYIKTHTDVGARPCTERTMRTSLRAQSAT